MCVRGIFYVNRSARSTVDQSPAKKTAWCRGTDWRLLEKDMYHFSVYLYLIM